MQGNGKMLCLNGDIYKGEFYENQPHGFGTYILKSGEIYEGNWK